MEKRTRILLIVLGALAVAAAGFYGYGMLFGGEERPPVQVRTAQKTPNVQAPAASQPGSQKAPAGAPAAQAQPKPSAAVPAQPVKPGAAAPSAAGPAMKQAQVAAGTKVSAPPASAPPRPAEAKAKEVKPEASAQKTYTYISLNKRDPFMNPLQVPKVFPPVSPNAKPYERVPVEQLSVKAILWNEKGFRAMIVTPDGRGYTVKVGDRIGDKRGWITKITERRVYVTEKIPDILGEVETKNTILQLHKEAE